MLSREEAICDYDMRKLTVHPHRLSRTHQPHYVGYAERMLDLYRQGTGRRRRDLHRDVEAVFAEEECHSRCIKAFQKLLDLASHFKKGRAEVRELRRAVFERAARQHPLARTSQRLYGHDEGEVKATIAGELRRPWEEIDDELFSDLHDFRRLQRFEGYTDALALLSRYNVAQTQAALYDAIEMRVRTGDRTDLKLLVRQIKWSGLVHGVERRCDNKPGYEFVFDGPASVHEHTRRYGVNMARFLPVLLACEDWEMDATMPGRTHLNVEQAKEVSVVPARALESAAHAGFGERLALGQAQGDAAQRGQVERGVILPDPAAVFVKVHVEHPVQLVLNGPVTPRHGQQARGVGGQAAQKEASLHAGGPASGGLTACFDHRHALHARPGRQPAQAAKQRAGLQRHGAARFDAPVVLLDGLRARGVLRCQRSRVTEESLHVRAEHRMVALEGQQVVAALAGDLRGDGFVAAHRVDGHHGSLKVEHAQQFRDGGDLVALVCHRHLAEHQAQTVSGKRADHVQGASALHAIEAAAQSFAVNGHVPAAVRRAGRALEPAQKAGVQFLGIEPPEHPLEGVVAGDAAWQVQEGAQPALFHRAPLGHVAEAFGSGQRGAERDQEDVAEQVAARALDARIGDPGKEPGGGGRGGQVHPARLTSPSNASHI